MPKNLECSVPVSVVKLLFGRVNAIQVLPVDLEFLICRWCILALLGNSAFDFMNFTIIVQLWHTASFDLNQNYLGARVTLSEPKERRVLGRSLVQGLKINLSVSCLKLSEPTVQSALSRESWEQGVKYPHWLVASRIYETKKSLLGFKYPSPLVGLRISEIKQFLPGFKYLHRLIAWVIYGTKQLISSSSPEDGAAQSFVLVFPTIHRLLFDSSSL